MISSVKQLLTHKLKSTNFIDGLKEAAQIARDTQSEPVRNFIRTLFWNGVSGTNRDRNLSQDERMEVYDRRKNYGGGEELLFYPELDRRKNFGPDSGEKPYIESYKYPLDKWNREHIGFAFEEINKELEQDTEFNKLPYTNRRKPGSSSMLMHINRANGYDGFEVVEKSTYHDHDKGMYNVRLKIADGSNIMKTYEVKISEDKDQESYFCGIWDLTSGVLRGQVLPHDNIRLYKVGSPLYGFVKLLFDTIQNHYIELKQEEAVS